MSMVKFVIQVVKLKIST